MFSEIFREKDVGVLKKGMLAINVDTICHVCYLDTYGVYFSILSTLLTLA